MDWNLTNDRPVYLQLIEHLELAIVSGVYSPGERMPGVREMAAQAAVNPNTMQRALQELETRGLINTQRTAGRHITEDKKVIDRLRTEKAVQQLEDFWNNMQKLGYQTAEILALLKQKTEESQ